MILYITVATCCALACVVFCFLIPDVPIKNNSLTLSEFRTNLTEYAQWFPQIRHLALALCLNMFCVSFFSGIMFYILNDDNVVPLFGTYVVFERAVEYFEMLITHACAREHRYDDEKYNDHVVLPGIQLFTFWRQWKSKDRVLYCKEINPFPHW